MTTFAEFFRGATGYGPCPYQCCLAEADSMPRLLDIPTGAGKTAGGDAGVVVDVTTGRHPVEVAMENNTIAISRSRGTRSSVK